ncbi:autophagy- protein 2 [Pseudogymnoascus destructans]|nr:autophagy- protein 2 [Pseudogymnoascus destructans]OAF55035.2 autophagy- protein 2 [Pseudogymnoascus destructans]
MLKLPPNIELAKAQVLLLRLTIPVDIYSSPIVVEVDGVEGHIKVSPEGEHGVAKGKSMAGHDRKQSKTAEGSWPGGPGPNDDPGSPIPTAADLAQSFIQTEPPEERAELEAAIMSQSVASLSDDGDDDSTVGTGAALALPAFMANFLKGIVDRLRVRVRGIKLNLDVDIPVESLGQSTMDPVTLQINIEDIDIEGVTADKDEGKVDAEAPVLPLKDEKRLVSLRNLRGFLISDAGHFASLTRSSGMPSPAATHSDLRSLKSQSISRQGFNSRSDVESPPLSVRDNLSTSNLASSPVPHDDEVPNPTSPVASSIGHSLEASGRFDDAPEDDDYPDAMDELPADMMHSILDNSEFLNEVADNQFSDDGSSEERNDFSFGSVHKKKLSSGRSPESTPRASTFLSSDKKLHTSRFTNPASLASSSRLDPRGASIAGSHIRAPGIARPHAAVANSEPVAMHKSGHSHYEETFASMPNLTGKRSGPPSDVSGSPSDYESLAESRLFTHEDAESMYMSALSHGSRHEEPAGGYNVPGSDSTEAPEPPWTPELGRSSGAQLPYSPDSAESTHEDEKYEIPIPAEEARSINSESDLTAEPDVQSETPTEEHFDASIPPIKKTETNISRASNISSDRDNRMAKQLFSLDHVGIYLPPTADGNGSLDKATAAEAAVMESSTRASIYGPQASESRFLAPDLPGAFSTPSIRARERPSVSEQDKPKKHELPAKEDSKSTAIEIVLGQLYAQVDVSAARLLFKLFQSISVVFEGNQRSQASVPEEEKEALPLLLKFHADRFSVKFLERLPGTGIPDTPFGKEYVVKPPSSDVLLRTTLKGLDISYDISQASTAASITLQKFVFGYAKENILSFDADLQMRESVRDLAATAGVDVSVKMLKTPDTSRYSIFTLPIHLSINLQKLDETFSWFGGLSSVLNMTSSMASSATMTTSSPAKTKPRGVRFDAPIMPDDESVSSQTKVDARIAGFVLDLIGKDCSVGLDTTAVKIVSRDEGIAVVIDQTKITGPHLATFFDDEPAIRAELTGMRLEYLETPKSADLDRLLALITPSKSKYDRDDDILLETLLRQRRQGAVLRVNIDQFKSRVAHLEQLRYLPDLGEEVSKLSTVAKYLPQDDRPGFLSLLLVKKFDLKVDINRTVGNFQARATDIEVAQINLPALVALSMDTFTVNRNDTEEIICAATTVAAKDRSPAIMARMIGDEMEPVIKLKLWNLRLEYNVPTLMTLLGLKVNATTEDMATGIAASVATLTDRKQISLAMQRGEAKGKGPKSQESKALTVDVAIRECILGLNPLGLPSKILVVMTEGHVSAVLPEDNNTNVTAEMGKGSLVAIDDVANIIAPTLANKSRRQSFDGGSSQVADLCSRGFVCLGYVASAKAIVRVSTGKKPGEKNIDVELRDELFVLETCADSTQTLIAALAALAPPSPPSKEVKYRTKVMPMQDLLASFTGDAFESNNLTGDFNLDEEFGSRLGSDISDNSNLEFDSQYYARPVGSLREDSPGESSQHGSLLFDQYNNPDQDTDDGVLLESFSSKQHVHINEELDFKEDYFGNGSMVEGTAHRWNSAKNMYDKSDTYKVRESPLKVCVRDVHVIWNLFDGYDWQATRDTITKTVQDIESRASDTRTRKDRRSTAVELDFEEEETVIGDFLFNSIYIGVPGNRDPRELAAAINRELHDNATETESLAPTTVSASPSRQAGPPRVKGKRLRLNRSKHHKITFELKGVNADVIAFPPGSGETQSSIDIRVHDFDIYDHVLTSTWKKFATYMHDAGEREAGSSQIHIELLNVRPVAELAASEIVLRATLLPLRLHVDQDALDFITRFFEFKDTSNTSSSGPSEPPFIQRAEVNDVQVKLDFKPKRVDYGGLRSGHTTEFMNFIVLDEANMVLRHTILYGVSGFDRLGKMLNDVWMPEIKQNQLPGILAGLAPVRSLANFGGGVRDLVEIPVREYRKDGRLVRALGKGAAAFAKTSGTELIKLGAKLAIGTQTVLEGAEGVLGVAPTQHHRTGGDWDNDGDSDSDEPRLVSLYADQPVGVVQGLRGAYKSLERDLVMARDAIIAVPGEVMESGSAVGAVRAVGRRAPTVILRPLVGGTKAVGKTLLGVGNWVDPGNLRRVDDKYKRH